MQKLGVILGLLLIGILLFGCSSIQQAPLNNSKILEIIKPEIDSYCQTLEDNAVDSACPTCKYYYPQDKDRSYVYVADIKDAPYEGHAYTIKNENGTYSVTMRMQLIFGRNDRPGSITLTFEIDDQGNILNKSLPILKCF